MNWPCAILGCLLALAATGCKPSPEARAAAERESEAVAERAEIRTRGERRDAAFKYYAQRREDLRTLGISGWGNGVTRHAARGRIEPLCGLVRDRCGEAGRKKMERLEALLEYLGRGLEQFHPPDDWTEKFAGNFPDEKMNTELGLKKELLDPSKIAAELSGLVVGFAKAAGIGDLVDER